MQGPDGVDWEFYSVPARRMLFCRRRIGSWLSPERCLGGIPFVRVFYDGSFNEECAPLESFRVEPDGNGFQIELCSPESFFDPPPDHLEIPRSFQLPYGNPGNAPGNESVFPLKHRIYLKIDDLPDNPRVLLIDGEELEFCENLHFFTESAEKFSGNPVITPDFPYEKLPYGKGSVLLEDGMWRMWYRARETPGQSFPLGKMEVEAENWQKFCNAAYAESSDGIHWVKPELNRVEYMGNTRNNLLPSIWMHAYVAQNPDPTVPERRLLTPEKLEYDSFVPELIHTHFSKNGVDWETVTGSIDYSRGIRAFFGAFNSILYDEEESSPERCWKAYGYFGTSPSRRCAGAWTSSDAIHWHSVPENPVLTPRHFDNSFIHDFCVWKDSGYYFGLLQYSKVKSRYDFILAASRDGIHFNRIGDGLFLQRGNPGEWDEADLTGGVFSPVENGNRLHFYYCSSDAEFKNPGIGLASCRKSRYAGLKAENKGAGRFRTRPFSLTGSCCLHFELETGHAGSLKWTLLSMNGEKVAEGNDKHNTRLDHSGFFRLEICLCNGAKLYGFSFLRQA